MQVHRRSIVASALVAAAAAWLTTAGQAQAGSPVVIHDVQASTDPYGATTPPGGNQSQVQPNTEIEPSIAVNPADAQDVVTAFQEGRVDAGGDADNGFAASLDGGSTWTFGNLPSITKAAPGCPNANLPGCAFDRASDAVVTFGKAPSGQGFHGYFVYVNSLVFDDASQNALPSGMAVNISKDGGKTWSDGVILEQDNIGGLNDKNWIVVDNGTGTGHHTGRVYVMWDRVVPVVYTYCDPDVKAPTAPAAGCEHLENWANVKNGSFYVLFPGQGIGTMPVVLNNGDLGVMFSSETTSPCPTTSPSSENCGIPGSSNIEWDYIAGAGSTVWPDPLPAAVGPITVATYVSSGITKQRAGSLPQVAVDPTTDDAFIVWEDSRFRTDGGATPGTSDSSNQNDPVFSMSTPTGGVPGATWSAPARIDTGAPTGDFVDRYNTTVAVGGDGLVRVAYRQRDENTAHGFSPSTGLGTPIDTYYQESSNHGSTWSAPLKVDVTQNTPDASVGAFSRGGLFEGDYEQIAAGAAGESYVTRDEAWKPALQGGVRTMVSVAGTCPTNFDTIPSTPCQNQQTWVALISSSPGNGQVPEVRFVPALVLLGAAAAVAWRRRERKAPTS